MADRLDRIRPSQMGACHVSTTTVFRGVELCKWTYLAWQCDRFLSITQQLFQGQPHVTTLVVAESHQGMLKIGPSKGAYRDTLQTLRDSAGVVSWIPHIILGLYAESIWAEYLESTSVMHSLNIHDPAVYPRFIMNADSSEYPGFELHINEDFHSNSTILRGRVFNIPAVDPFPALITRIFDTESFRVSDVTQFLDQ
ncbi:MAG: hypothetical protein ACRC8S_17485 [Fimbriiglobus sp.]